MRTALFIAILLCSSLLYAADPKPPDACKILTSDDVAKVVGSGFKNIGFTGTASDNSNCAYMKDRNNLVNLMIVTLSGMTADAALAQMQKQYESQSLKITAVKGAGVGAFYSEFGNHKTLHFGKGPWHAVLDVTLSGKPDSDAEEKLATTAYGKLP